MFDGIRAGVASNRAQFYEDLTPASGPRLPCCISTSSIAVAVRRDSCALGRFGSELLCGGNARWYAMTPLVMISGSLTNRDLGMVKRPNFIRCERRPDYCVPLSAIQIVLMSRNIR